MLEEVRQALPGSLAQAEELIGGREQMVEQARQEAERIIESAHAERGSLISDTEVARRSQDEADRILAEARQEAEEVRAEADDYVDSKLANFEVVLTKTLGSVGRGREKLLGTGPGIDEQGYEDEDAPERSHDPETLRRSADEYVDVKLGAFEAVLAKTLDAVGRGRQKLHGRIASDDLGAWAASRRTAHAAAHQRRRLPGRPRGARRAARRAGPRPAPGPGRSRPSSRLRPAGRVRLSAADRRIRTGTSSSTPSRTRTATSSRPPTRTPPTRSSRATTSSRRTTRASSRPTRQPAGAPAAGRAGARPRRDQPLRHQHDQRGAAAGVRTGALTAGLGRERKVQYPGSSVACTSAINAAREAPKGGAPRASKIESRNGPERPPRPPQPSRVRHTRAGAASWRAAAPDPRRSTLPRISVSRESSECRKAPRWSSTSALSRSWKVCLSQAPPVHRPRGSA